MCHQETNQSGDMSDQAERMNVTGLDFCNLCYIDMANVSDPSSLEDSRVGALRFPLSLQRLLRCHGYSWSPLTAWNFSWNLFRGLQIPAETLKMNFTHVIAFARLSCLVHWWQRELLTKSFSLRIPSVSARIWGAAGQCWSEKSSTQAFMQQRTPSLLTFWCQLSFYDLDLHAGVPAWFWNTSCFVILKVDLLGANQT